MIPWTMSLSSLVSYLHNLSLTLVISSNQDFFFKLNMVVLKTVGNIISVNFLFVSLLHLLTIVHLKRNMFYGISPMVYFEGLSIRINNLNAHILSSVFWQQNPLLK